MDNQHETSRTHHRHLFTPRRMGGLFAAGAIVFAACGGGGGKTAAANSMAGMAMPPAAVGNATDNAAAVATEAVSIKNFAFSPTTITVKAGATAVWTNDDAIQHDVTFDSGGPASSVLNHGD